MKNDLFSNQIVLVGYTVVMGERVPALNEISVPETLFFFF